MQIIDDPFLLFKDWYKEACLINKYANAMSLATCNIDAIPSVRTVLLKDYNDSGFVFYTNLNSKKGNDLHNNPKAELLFFWQALEKQIRISGYVQQVSNKEADDYFATRSYDSQISAWASNQSQIIPKEICLEDRCKEFENKFLNMDKIPRPSFWSGFRLNPVRYEFWEEKQFRRHIRCQYRKIDSKWMKNRIFP